MHNASQLKLPTLQQQQSAFAAAIRDPLHNPVMAGVSAARMALYHELFYNNFTETLARAFPVLRQVLDATHWQSLCQQFFVQHTCSTPYLARLPGEFVDFLRQCKINNPLWLLELALWEWTELELLLAPDPVLLTPCKVDVIHGIPLLSPLLRVHAFDFAVHKICTDYLPNRPDAQKNYLAAWRKLDDSITFMQVNEFSYRLLQLLKNNREHTGFELLTMIAGEQTEYEVAVIIRGGSDMLQSFYQKNIVLGAQTL